MKALFIDDHIVEEIDNLARETCIHYKSLTRTSCFRPEHRWENCGIMMWTNPGLGPG